MHMARALLFLFVFPLFSAQVTLGIDRFFEEDYAEKYKGKGAALITNQTGVDGKMRPTQERLSPALSLVALLSPEHGLQGSTHAGDVVASNLEGALPVYSLYGKTRRPTPEMFKGVDLLLFDVQTTGVRAYTYETTLFYAMEEAARHGVEVVVFDRPNPVNGITVDGPMLEEECRSFLGYINIPYCHGMTIGELARFFNEEYKVGCKLTIIPMKGWQRSMSFRDTGLPWIPPSPCVPEPDTSLFCLMTGILGELSLVSIGIGCSFPFKVVGAPWIRADLFASELNRQKLPGVHFQPFHFTPYWGVYKGQECHGVWIQVTDLLVCRPVAVQYMLLGLLKSLYPKEVARGIEGKGTPASNFCRVNGTSAVYETLVKEKFPAWKLLQIHKEERAAFLEKRRRYLLY
ncbi:MAG: DUF1343 domain-containing protein [Verrucomicrobiota bacterium]|nr:DUF1343 domain-containing protein [Verrucomicrobiota bacterium]